jgi:hypothetical protein
MQAMASEVDPLPPASRNLQPMMRADHATPTTPVALPPIPAMVPEQWLPWPWSSSGSPSLFTVSMPCTSSIQPLPSSSTPLVSLPPPLSPGLIHMFAAMSSCVYKTPVSITATTTPVAEVRMSQASGASMSASSTPPSCPVLCRPHSSPDTKRGSSGTAFSVMTGSYSTYSYAPLARRFASVPSRSPLATSSTSTWPLAGKRFATRTFMVVSRAEVLTFSAAFFRALSVGLASSRSRRRPSAISFSVGGRAASTAAGTNASSAASRTRRPESRGKHATNHLQCFPDVSENAGNAKEFELRRASAERRAGEFAAAGILLQKIAKIAKASARGAV